MAKSSTPTEAPADDLKTEKQKGSPDPVNKSVQPDKAKTIEEHGIGASDPYPTGGAQKE